MVINNKIKQKRRGGKYRSPLLLHDKIMTCGHETKEHSNGDWRTGENVREQGDGNSEQFSDTEIQRGVGGILSVLNRGNERQEEKCRSCSETSVWNYHYSLRNIPEGRSS